MTDNQPRPQPSSSAPSHQKPWIKSYPVDIDWNTPVPAAATMVEMFDNAVRDNAKKTAMQFMGRKYTYAELGKMADKFAKSLQDQGIGPGTTVGLSLPNTPFYVVAYFGAMKAGATVANFNPLYAEEEVEHQIKDSNTQVMVAITLKGAADKPIYPTIEKMMGGRTPLKKIIYCELADVLPTGKSEGYRLLNFFKGLTGKSDEVKVKRDKNHVPFSAMLNNNGKFKPVAIKPSDVAVLQYTGGTTGVPKAAMLTHENLSTNVEQTYAWFTAGKKSAGQEKMLAVLPFFHVFCMTVQMNLSIRLGGELVMLPRFNEKETLEAIEKNKITIFAGVPTLYQKLVNYKKVNDYDLSSMKICVSGGAPLTSNISDGFKKLTGVDIVEGYGLSETSPLVTANPVHGTKKPNSIGIPMPQTDVKIADLNLPDSEVPIKMEGEICLKGPQVMKGYWNRPDETAKVMDKDGFFHTGDVGYVDEDGYVFIVDRIKDMVIVNGFKVFSRKVEEAILKNDKISEAIVIGVKDDKTGESVKAFVVPKEGQSVTAAELREFLKDKLVHYELPREGNIEFRDSLPKTMIGKPDKKAIKEEERKKTETKTASVSAPKPKI